MKYRIFAVVLLLCGFAVALSVTSAQQTPIAYDSQGHALFSGPDCVSKASPAVCGSTGTGGVVVAAGATTVVVNDTTVTNTSHIFLQEDASMGTLLGVTCNTTAATAPPTISAKVTGTSFTITTTAPTTNPRCFSFHIFN